MKVHEYHLRRLSDLNAALNQLPNVVSFTGTFDVYDSDYDDEPSARYRVRYVRKDGTFEYERVA